MGAVQWVKNGIGQKKKKNPILIPFDHPNTPQMVFYLLFSPPELPPRRRDSLRPRGALDVVGLLVGAGEQVVATDALADLRPPASPAAQEGPTDHGEDTASPADKHRLTKLNAARGRG